MSGTETQSCLPTGPNARLSSFAGMHRISIRQAFDFAWPIFKQRFGLFTTVLLTFFGAWVALEVVIIAGQRFGILLWSIAHLAFLIFFAGMELGFFHICIALYDRRDPTFADTFKHLTLGPKFLAGQMLYLLMVAIGLLLLVVPGIYLSARYGLFGFCMAAGETDLMRSFQQSAALSTGSRPHLFWIFAALLLFNGLGASLLGIGLFITIPFSALVVTAVFRQLSSPDRST